MEEEKESIQKGFSGKPPRQYKKTRSTKYHVKDDLVWAWVRGDISLTSILKMFRSVKYGQDRSTRKELYRAALHTIHIILANIHYGAAQNRKAVAEKWGQRVVDREIERNKRPKKVINEIERP